MPGKAWTPQEIDQLRQLSLIEKKTPSEIAQIMRRTFDSVDSKLRFVKSVAVSEAALSPATRDSRDEYIQALEAKCALLESQLTWAQHAKSDIRQGGTLTHRESDCHYADSNHLLGSCEQSWVKSLEVIKQYAPTKIQLVWGDDYVAGRGIYKNQDLDVVTSNADEQCQIGAVHFRRRIESIREITNADIHITWLKGNHEYSMGHPLAGYMFLLAKQITSDYPGVYMQLAMDEAIVNLAHEGYYNALFLHGYGFSNLSPNSPRFISDVKDKLLIMHREMPPEQQIHRIASGHTHQFSKGIERNIGFYWDTTGGWQRNARVQLGFNQRPSGTIIYVSLPGMTNEILEPIGCQPNTETYLREISDTYLPQRNRADASECLIEYDKIMQSMGVLQTSGSYGTLHSGRW